MSNERVKKAIAACHKRHENRRELHLFTVRYCISSRLPGIDGDDIDDDLKATLEEWAIAMFDMKYREDLLLRFIDEQTDAEVEEAIDFVDEKIPKSKEAWRRALRSRC